MKQLKFTGFMILGFLMTVIIWGFIGGCGNKHTLDYNLEGSFIGTQEERKEGVEKSTEENAIEEVKTVDDIVQYTVKKGDTLWSISKQYGVSLEELRKINKLKNDVIFPGQVLIIPQREITQEGKEKKEEIVESAKSYGSGELIVYKVRRGDSLWRIAQKCGTTVERIVDLNGLRRDSKLIPGQELLVPRYETKR